MFTNLIRVLTRVKPIFHFYTPWKRQETRGIELEYWRKMGQVTELNKSYV